MKYFFFSLLIFLLGTLPINSYESFFSETSYIEVTDRDYPGFFSNFLSVLGFLNQYENGQCIGIKVNFKNKGLYYDPKKSADSWDYYFEGIETPNNSNQPLDECCHEELSASATNTVNLERHIAYELIKKYIKVKSYILEEVNGFIETNFPTDSFIIGVHYRSTDKIWSGEAKYVSYQRIVDVVCEIINKESLYSLDKNYMLFIATDDANFLDWIMERFPTHVIYQESIRSNNHEAIHYLHKNTKYTGGPRTNHGYQLGKEALIDALLLSRCNYLIRTSSNLSLCSTFFNPLLPVILVR